MHICRQCMTGNTISCHSSTDSQCGVHCSCSVLKANNEYLLLSLFCMADTLIHRHPFARDVVDRLRSQHADVLVVDMGWPSDDRQYADVATFGASRLMGDVLLKWLAFGDNARVRANLPPRATRRGG